MKWLENGQERGESPVEHSVPAMDVDISKLTLEERVQVRRQRALLLKRQAEERVQEMAKQKADLERYALALMGVVNYYHILYAYLLLC